MKLTIPEIRERLLVLSKEIEFLAAETIRRSPVRKAKIKAVKVTDELASRVRSYAKIMPLASYKEIANAFGVNQGRISEILAGKRGK
jgi:hypothetical protein